MATHSSVLAWRIPRTEEPGGLWSLGSPNGRHSLATTQQQHICQFSTQETTHVMVSWIIRKGLQQLFLTNSCQNGKMARKRFSSSNQQGKTQRKCKILRSGLIHSINVYGAAVKKKYSPFPQPIRTCSPLLGSTAFVSVEVCQSHLGSLLCPWDSPEYRSELPFPSPGNLPNPGNEPRFPALQADS